jgi:hypothetical protein
VWIAREERADVRVGGRAGIDDLGGSRRDRRHVARPVAHSAVGERGAVVHHEHPGAPDPLGCVEHDRRVGAQDPDAGVHGAGGLDRALDVRLGSGPDLVDDDHVRHSHDRLAGMMRRHLVGTQCIDEDDVEPRRYEGPVVVSPVPDDDVALALRALEDGRVIHSGKDHPACVHVGLVLLALLDRALPGIEIATSREALNALLRQVTVGHRVSQHSRLESAATQPPRDPPGRLGLSAARAHRGNGDHGLARAQHRALGSQHPEIGPTGQRPRGQVHHVCVGEIAVGEDHLVHGLTLAQLFES